MDVNKTLHEKKEVLFRAAVARAQPPSLPSGRDPKAGRGVGFLVRTRMASGCPPKVGGGQLEEGHPCDWLGVHI